MKERFYRTFMNVPLGERTNAIYVDDKFGAMSWLVLNIEVRADTPVAQRALDFLARTGII